MSNSSQSSSEGNLTPGSYEIREILFFPNQGTTAETGVDISQAVGSITIEEDLNHPFIECVLGIIDAANFYEEQRISGNEKVTIDIKRSPLAGTKEKISEFKLTFFIAEVFNFVRNAPGKQFYKFRLVSEHLYTNQSKTLQRSFQGSIGKLVKDICIKDLKVSKATINSDTKDIIKGVYPTIRPIQAINWLLKNAFDNSTPYFFYETLKDGLQFNSLENLYEKDIYEEYQFVPFFDHDIGTTGSYDEIRTRIKSFTSDLNMGKLNDVGSGAYASTLHTIDLATKSYKKTVFNYDSSSPKKLSKEKPFSDNYKILDRGLSELKEGKNYFISLNSEAYPSHKNYHAPAFSTILKSESHLQTLGFNTHTINLPGDFGLQVGNKIKIQTIKSTSIKDSDDATVMLDKYNGGTYLVTRVVHNFGDTYNMIVTIQRDSVEARDNA
jgi:hypothetical protein